MAAKSSASQFDLAILGADTPLGEAVLSSLDEREIPIGRLFPLTMNEPDNSVSFRGEDWPCLAAEDFDPVLAQALLVVSHGKATERLVKQIRAQRPTMPILEADALDPAVAVITARVLKPIAAISQLVSADAFVTLPVSLAGKEGVDELVRQTRGLFNMESPEPEVFPLQIAFNLLPNAQAIPNYARLLTQATARLADGFLVGFSVTTGPLFFGAAMALHVRTVAPGMDIAALRNALVYQDGITLMEDDHPAAMPTPATDALGSEDVFLGPIQLDGELCRFWLVFDPITLDAVRMAASVENWIDKPANSMLT